MNVLSSPGQWPQTAPTCLTIGNFDGVHRGHQILLETASRIASENGLHFLPITFWPPPQDILHPENAKPKLTSREEKLSLLSCAGASAILEIPFSAELASLAPGQFVSTWLLPLKPAHIVIGHDFHFGSGRSGAFAKLTGIGAKARFSVTQIEAARHAGAPISSTRIREALLLGDVSLATRLLGRPYSLEGKVEHGFARGRELGFPTANLTIPAKLLPALGVYAARVWHQGKPYLGVTNIGRNPTFNGEKLTIETFLPDASLDLYGQLLKVEFLRKLRDEKKFASPEELKARIAADITDARRIYAESGF